MSERFHNCAAELRHQENEHGSGKLNSFQIKGFYLFEEKELDIYHLGKKRKNYQIGQRFPNLFGTRDRFHGKQFFRGHGRGGERVMTQDITFTVHFISIWRRNWQPTPVLLPGKSHGRRSVVGCSPWGRKESDTTELLHFHFISAPPKIIRH